MNKLAGEIEIQRIELWAELKLNLVLISIPEPPNQTNCSVIKKLNNGCIPD
jgi:hypothetical protein